MEEGRSTGNGSSRAAWLLTQAQVAVAVGVIRSRPPGTSGREHAEELGRRMRRQEAAWRETAQVLRQEVLRLRQELLMSRSLVEAERSRQTTADAVVEDTSLDLFAPLSGADPPPDRDSETPDLLLQEPAAPPQQRHCGSDALLPHMRFLQHLCSLQRLDASSSGLQPPDGDGGSVVAQTVCLLLDSVAAACRDPPALAPPDLLLQACRVASRASELLCSAGRPSVDFMRRVEEPLRELTQMLLHSKHPSMVAGKLSESLIALGSCSISKSFLICHILSQISSLAEQLWQTSQVQESSVLRRFPMDQYQNSFHLLWILERLLQDAEVPWWRADVESEKMIFLHHLEHRLFFLSEEFPLFSIYMWRIGNLLTTTK
ncbi:meiosis-specific protein MEI4 [Fundulus heteroclitus]|uniref:meiosis-specific protein MEI4 n=1 Tax=Fundulus heteroclitus TaxID=8078 RepID=UPI00165A9758|nr:meiosis-specific protein MEI4 [Fundulus heteroclitus]